MTCVELWQNTDTKLCVAFLSLNDDQTLRMGWWKGHKTYKGCHVFITGGSTGIGLSLALQFAKLGANISLVSRTQSKLDAAKKEIQIVTTEDVLPGKVLMLSADVSKNHEASVYLSFSMHHYAYLNLGWVIPQFEPKNTQYASWVTWYNYKAWALALLYQSCLPVWLAKILLLIKLYSFACLHLQAVEYASLSD